MSAGLVENALKEIYTDYARRTVSRPVANYVISHISQIRNPKIDRFIEIAAAFNEDWKNELENYANTNGRCDAVTSIMLHRHRIAHGQSHTSSISMAQIKEYLAKAIEVLEFVEDQCRR